MSEEAENVVDETEKEDLEDAIFRNINRKLELSDALRCEIRDSFEEYLPEGAEGLNKELTKNALFDSGQNPTDDDIEEFWHEKGKADEDVLTDEEFIELYDKLGDPKIAIKEALEHFDKNKNGKIDREELRDILEATGALENVAGKDSYVDIVLSLGDKNDDNELDIDELVTMIQDGLIKFKSDEEDKQED